MEVPESGCPGASLRGELGAAPMELALGTVTQGLAAWLRAIIRQCRDVLWHPCSCLGYF